MPKIPTTQFKTRLSTDPVRTPTRSVSSAGIVEGAFADTAFKAAGLANEIRKRREVSERDAFIDSQSVDFAIDYQNIESEARKEFSGDNSKGLTDAIRKRAEKMVGDRARNAPSGLAGDAFVDKANQFLTSRLARSQAFENQEIAKANRAKVSQTTSNLAFELSKSGDPLFGAAQGEQHIQAIRNKVGVDFTQEEANLLEAEARLKISSGAILGLMRNGQYEKALNLVDNNYMRAFDAKSADKMRKTIADRYRRDINDVARLRKLEESEAKSKFEAQEKDIMADLFSRSAAGEDVQAELVERVRNKEISVRSANMLRKSVFTPDQREKSDQIKFGFVTRITSGSENLEDVRKDIIRAGSDGSLAVDDASSLLKSVEAKQNRIASSPTDKQKVKVADSLLKAKFPAKNQIGMFIPEQQELQAQAMAERDALITNGADPMQATRAIIKKYKGEFESLPLIPGVPFDLQKEPILNRKGILRILKTKLDRGELSKEEVLEFGRLLQERIDAFESKDYMSVEDLNNAGR